MYVCMYVRQLAFFKSVNNIALCSCSLLSAFCSLLLLLARGSLLLLLIVLLLLFLLLLLFYYNTLPR